MKFEAIIKNRMKQSKILSVILVFLLIFYNNETMPSIFFKWPVGTIFLLLLLISILFFYSIIIKKNKINTKSMVISISLICLIFNTILLNSDFTGGYIKIIMSIVIGFMLIHLVTFDEFIEAFIKVIVFLALYSLIVTYLVRPLSFSMPGFIFPRYVNSAGVPFIDARFSVIVDIQNYYRNFGIFREPGVYQIFLNFALMFELFFKKSKLNIIRMIILYITIVSTFSTPGYVSASLIIISFLLLTINKNKLLDKDRKTKMLLAFFLVLMFSLTIILIFSNNLFNSLFAGTMSKLVEQESSYQGRTIAVLANLSTWLQSPFFGNGITQSLTIDTLTKMQSNYSVSSSHNTSTIGAMLSTFGLFFTSIIIYLIYKIINKSNWNIVSKLLLFISILITINTQLLIYNELLYILIVYGIVDYKFWKRLGDNKRECRFLT